MAEDAVIQVQVCYATPRRQWLREVEVAAGTTLHEAVKRSGILEDAPEIDLSILRTGVFGKIRPLDAVLRDRDRIEIYRFLLADPKDARRRRATGKAE